MTPPSTRVFHEPGQINIGLQLRPGTCPDCGAESNEHRMITDLKQSDTKPWTRNRCQACGHKLESAREEERREAEQRERARANLAALRIPPLYAAATCENFELHGEQADREKQSRALQLARRYVGTWPDVALISVFVGAPGSGKGHLVWAIGRTLVETYGVSARVAVLSDVIRDLREAWGSHEEGGLSEAERLGRYRAADLLVIDEVSRHAFYGQPQQHLYDLVAWRELQMRPTILTTNESGQSLADFLGPALASRALGWGAVIDFGTADYRLKRRIARAS